MTTSINFTRINNDTNGNPRYVFHFLNLINDKDMKNKNVDLYSIALKKAKNIGGKKFHNKQYGGGIVIQSYNIQHDEQLILELNK